MELKLKRNFDKLKIIYDVPVAQPDRAIAF